MGVVAHWQDMVNIAHRLVCCDCGEPIGRGQPAWQRAHGWVLQRTEGGTNHLHCEEREPGRFICGVCLDIRKHGGVQGSLL